MIYTAVLIGGLTGFFAALFGWQVNLVSIHRGLNRGRAAAFLTGLGAVVADIIFMALVFSGTTPLANHPEWWKIIKWVGIATILVLAVRIMLMHPKSDHMLPAEKSNPTRNFILGFIIVITNPGVFFLWIGVLGFILTNFPALQAPPAFGFFLSGFVMGAAVWFLTLAGIFLGHIRQWKEERLRLISRISAFALLIAAIVLILKKF